jgi:hypothetical protein
MYFNSAVSALAASVFFIVDANPRAGEAGTSLGRRAPSAGLALIE